MCRITRSLKRLGVLIASVAFASTSLWGQGSPPRPAGKKEAPRTAQGKPDLQGVWDFRTITPMERPTELAGKATLTDEEAAKWERDHQRNQDDRTPTPTVGTSNGSPTTLDVERAYNDFWWDFGKKIVGTRRTSLVVDPPDGRIPPLTEEAKRRAAVRLEHYSRTAEGPEDRGVSERCILGFNSGPPMIPSAYNNNVQIVQTSDYVVLLNEMVHNARVIPLDSRPHIERNVRQWVGDSRGHWDGDTLVIETTNFLGETAFPNSTANLRLTERIKRVDADTLLYEFTADDPTTWTRPWTAQVPMMRSSGNLYEYACHEGNYGMMNLLSAARSVDRAQGAKGGK
jgi:hypothetical protein